MNKANAFATGAKLLSVVPAFLAGLSMFSSQATGQDMSNGADNFYKSDKVTVEKVTFKNQYQMTVAGNLFLPKDSNQDAKHPAIVVGHPMGAVKEQSANLYATKMAEQGFVALSVDLSFWGESEGEPRNAVVAGRLRRDLQRRGGLPGHAAVRRPEADRGHRDLRERELRHQRGQDRPAIRAIATVSMYDMGAANRHALKKSLTLEQRKKVLDEAAEQRYAEFAGGKTKYTSGTVHELTADTHPIQREFYDFYRTPRGEFTPKGSLAGADDAPDARRAT